MINIIKIDILNNFFKKNNTLYNVNDRRTEILLQYV